MILPGRIACDEYGLPIQTGLLDAFGHHRVAEPTTLFDSKQLHDSQPLFWDDQEVSGSGTSSAHDADRASTIMTVGATTAGKRVRQTFQRFNYQPGKSQLIKMTGVLSPSGGQSGIDAKMGLFDDENGVYVGISGGTVSFGIRSYVTGSAVDNEVAQASWNVDPMNGSGRSEVTLDPTKSQIFWFDLEWLGVGSVRCGFVIDGKFIHCHTFHHANIISSVYMSTPNLPLRYEIENDGTGPEATLEHICSDVESEGGQEANGVNYCQTTDQAGESFTSGGLFAIIGIRLKAARLDQVVLLRKLSLWATSSVGWEWRLYWNPTVAATFTYNDDQGSVQIAIGTAANTVSGGNLIDGGLVGAPGTGSAESNVDVALDNALRLGSAIDGTPDELVVAVKPAGNTDIEAVLGWKELV